MSAYEKMDIFFIIASIGFIVLTILTVIVGVLIARFLRKLNTIADDARLVSSDIKDITDEMHGDITRAHSFVHGLLTFLKPVKKKKK